MPRIPRSRLGSGIYHVINRALDRRFIFQDETDKGVFVQLLREGLEHQEVTVQHWVVMSNHFHLAAEVRKAEALSLWLANATRRYSRHYHQRHGGSGPVWERRFKSIMVLEAAAMKESVPPCGSR